MDLERKQIPTETQRIMRVAICSMASLVPIRFLTICRAIIEGVTAGTALEEAAGTDFGALAELQ
jgi:hypothetical protein